jgi:hypothetical protein
MAVAALTAAPRDPAGRYITFDAPGAALQTVASGADDRGRIVGGYVDARSETARVFAQRRGPLHHDRCP